MNRQHGLTLPELLVALLIFAMVSTAAVLHCGLASRRAIS